MIDRPGSIDNVLRVQPSKTYQVRRGDPDRRSARRDAVTISKFSALVERGRECAMALPPVRADRVSEVKSSLASGFSHESTDIASAMINGAAEGRI